jgi:methionine sulfoxide reductase heme-binding subunit
MRRSRLSALQILVHTSAWIPLIVLLVDYQTGNLTINPYQAAERRAGNIALILFLLSLACTPVNMLFKLPAVIKIRRPLGLYGYMYAAIHLFIFIGLDYGFDLELILLDVGEKRFIFAGLTAFIILSLLAITSFRWWMVRLARRWKQLHRLVYVANLVIVLHFAWAVKGDFFRLQGEVLRPLLALSAVTTLLVLRIPAVRKKLTGRLRITWPVRKTSTSSELPSQNAADPPRFRSSGEPPSR